MNLHVPGILERELAASFILNTIYCAETELKLNEAHTEPTHTVPTYNPHLALWLLIFHTCL